MSMLLMILIILFVVKGMQIVILFVCLSKFYIRMMIYIGRVSLGICITIIIICVDAGINIGIGMVRGSSISTF